jgi:hypothetical protein
MGSQSSESIRDPEAAVNFGLPTGFSAPKAAAKPYATLWLNHLDRR